MEAAAQSFRQRKKMSENVVGVWLLPPEAAVPSGGQPSSLCPQGTHCQLQLLQRQPRTDWETHCG